MCVLQMYAYLATYQMPNDDPEKLEARVRVKYPVVIDQLVGARDHADAAAPARARHRGPLPAVGEGPRLRSHWVWFAFPHGTVAYVLLKHREQFPSAAARDLRDVRHRRHRLLGDPDRPAVVRGAAGPDGGRPHAGAAPDDGRVRRAVLEAGLGASVRCSGRQSPGRHAVAALRHLRDGRARAERHRSCRGRCSAGPTRPRSGSRSSTWASTTSTDLAAGLALAEGIRVATPTVSPAATPAQPDAAAARGQGAVMTSAPEQTVEPRPPGDEHEDDDRGLEFTGRGVLTLCGFLAAMILGLYLLLPQLAGLEDTWEPDRGRLAVLDPARVRVRARHVLGLHRDVPRRLLEGRQGRDRPHRELPDHDGRARRLAHLRRGRRRRPRAAGLGAAPGGPAASASWPTRRSASSS